MRLLLVFLFVFVACAKRVLVHQKGDDPTDTILDIPIVPIGDITILRVRIRAHGQGFDYPQVLIKNRVLLKKLLRRQFRRAGACWEMTDEIIKIQPQERQGETPLDGLPCAVMVNLTRNRGDDNDCPNVPAALLNAENFNKLSEQIGAAIGKALQDWTGAEFT
eukprot:Platyproteum_vivax@DN16579_c0_g1_i1.p1